MRVSNHIKAAVGKLSQHKGLSHDLLVTNDFGQITPVMALPLLPRDKMKIHAGCFARVAPMIFPTYGSCEVVTNFHQVQYNQVWKDFDLFVTGQRTIGTGTLSFPVISDSVLYSYFGTSVCSYKGNADIDNHDFVYVKGGTTNYLFLTNFGRYVRKILNVLGYPFVSYYDDSETSVTYFSALPFLSFLKVYVDFYESRQYSNTSVLREILNQVYKGSTGSYWTLVSTNSYRYNSLVSLSPIFSALKLLFPSDYFTSAQAYPSLVGGSVELSFSSNNFNVSPFFQEHSLQQSVKNTNYVSNVFNNSSGQGIVEQSNPMHRLLDNFENLIRRFNLAGSRDIDRIRSQFGIRPSIAHNFYSKWIGGFNSPLHVQDVTSTSAEPSVDNYLGSYAGKGIVSNNDSFEVISDDFGILIGLSFIKVKPLYSPGLNREVLKTNFMSFYNPDFDHGYSMAIALGEVKSYDEKSPSNLLSVFGYQNAYDEYRFIPSRIAGDFIDSDLLPWSFARDNIGSVAQSDNVIYQTPPNSSNSVDSQNQGIYNEFQRIFVDGSGRDHFYLYYNFDISALRPVRTSSECFDLGVGDVSTSNNPVI